MNKINFVTGNDYKFQIARETLRNTDIKLVQKRLDVPEIQSDNVSEIASFSAKWASEKINEPVAVTDAGYFIEALNGFPGPFIKFTNLWFTAEDYLKLMEGRKNRSVIIKGCLAYCEPGKEPIIFNSLAKAKIAKKQGERGDTPINEIFIPEGYDKPESEIPKREMIKFWSSIESYWSDLADHLKKVSGAVSS